MFVISDHGSLKISFMFHISSISIQTAAADNADENDDILSQANT